MFPFLLRCLNAYADPGYRDSLPRKFVDELEASIPRNSDPLLSPLLTPEEILARFPPTLLIVSDMDPCLDETVVFSNRLIQSGVPEVRLEIFEGLPHGFFSYSGMSGQCLEALNEATEKLKIWLKL
jgi:acetyl esterase/lipase